MHSRDELDLAAGPHRTPKVDPPAADVSRSTDVTGGAARAMLDLQRLAGNASVSQLVAREPADDLDDAGGGQSPVLDVVGRGGGEPLAPDLRTEMEGRLGADFGDVRVHRDAAASDSAESVSANAYTVGQDIVFRSDQWNPTSTEGKRTLAHELTHVVQQAAGPVAGTPAPGGINVSSPDDEFERAADRTADMAMAGAAPSAPASGAMAAPGASAQLQAADEELEDETTAQGDWVQRQAGISQEELEEEEEGKTAQGDWVQRQGDEEELDEEDVARGT
jgi:Domain of unknown function (DUF4157)